MYFPSQVEAFGELLNSIRGERVAVIGHMRPDGDCIGSQVALCRMLNQNGYDAVAVNHHAVPRYLESFLGDTPFYSVDQYEKNELLSIHVDCADPVRIGEPLLGLFPEIHANIDHHISNTEYAKFNVVEAHTAATAEILAGLFVDQGWSIDPVSAQALYVGIATDTGQFRFPSTSPQVFKICSHLIDCGANPGAAAQFLYENESFNKLELLQHFLSSLTLECSDRVCIGLLPNGVYEKTGATRDDSEGLVDYARCIEGVEIGLLLEERDGGVKGSFRAKEPRYEVHRIAKEFNGGGHACAAGFNVKNTTIDALLPKMKGALEEHLRWVDSNR